MTTVPEAGRPATLGFGCGNLGGEIPYRASCTLLEVAYEAGLRHFDVAPSYGGGMAESVVGDVLAPVRSGITLVSKAGIPHPRAAGITQKVRALVRPIKSLLPGLWQRAGVRVRRAAAPTGRFQAAEVLITLEESLRRLRTDYLDALLLHEVRPNQITSELQGLLTELRAAGRARLVGIATGVEASQALLAEHPGLIDWVQTDHYWGAFLPMFRDGRRLVTHRVLRTGLQMVALPEFRAHLRRVDADDLLAAVDDPREAGQLLLRAALARVGAPNVVLFSSARPERIRQVVGATVHDPRPDLTDRLNAAFGTFRASMGGGP